MPPVTEVLHGDVHPGRALIVEDVRVAEVELRKQGYECDRLTHNELLSSSGAEYTGKLLKGEYNLLWICTPDDWHVRTSAKKSTTHWQRIQNWIQKAMLLGIMLVVFGPPGFLWKMPNIKETLQDSNMQQMKIRVCHFDLRYDRSNKQPSGSYMQLATNATISSRMWQCNCNIPITDHVLDWYGRSQPQAEWRMKVAQQFTHEICEALHGTSVSVETRPTYVSHGIKDAMTPPLPISDINKTTSLPTDARIRQKERLTKLKEAGLKPKKKVVYIEPGNDDCGNDISGLGPDAVLLSSDVSLADSDSSDDDDIFLTLPKTMNDSTANVFNVVASLCYGHYNSVDLLEVGGGRGILSKIAFQRGLSCGGNLDVTTGCNLRDPAQQEAVLHYITTCNVTIAILQPDNKDVVRFCGHLARKQMLQERSFILQQPKDSGFEKIHPWNHIMEDDNMNIRSMTKRTEIGTARLQTTEWITNAGYALHPLQPYMTGHKIFEGSSRDLCELVITGIQRMIAIDARISMTDRTSAFPTASTNTDRVPRPVLPARGMGCTGCDQGLRRDSPVHSRDPTTCRHPDILPVRWECPACQDDKGRSSRFTDPGHLFEEGKCRFSDRAPPSRIGAHPREPRMPNVSHPSAEASSHDVASDSRAEPAEHGDVPADAEHGNVPARGRPHGAQDSEPRVRRVYADAGTGTVRLPDWSRFNIQISLRNLRSYVPSVVQRELRKLHLRWWHAKEPKMRTLLAAAGLDEVRLAMIKPIVDTCRECRAWQKRGNEVMPSLSLPTKFNEQGECDLMFYK